MLWRPSGSLAHGETGWKSISRGAIYFGYQLAILFSLTPARCGAPVIPNSLKVFVGADLSGRKGGFAGVRAQPPGFNADPKFSLANSPVSPVDRLRLLTAPSNLAAQEFRISNSACRARLKARGLRIAGAVPFGYEADPQPKQLPLIADEATVVSG